MYSAYNSRTCIDEKTNHKHQICIKNNDTSKLIRKEGLESISRRMWVLKAA